MVWSIAQASTVLLGAGFAAYANLPEGSTATEMGLLGQAESESRVKASVVELKVSPRTPVIIWAA